MRYTVTFRKVGDPESRYIALFRDAGSSRVEMALTAVHTKTRHRRKVDVRVHTDPDLAGLLPRALAKDPVVLDRLAELGGVAAEWAAEAGWELGLAEFHEAVAVP